MVRRTAAEKGLESIVSEALRAHRTRHRDAGGDLALTRTTAPTPVNISKGNNGYPVMKSQLLCATMLAVLWGAAVPADAQQVQSGLTAAGAGVASPLSPKFTIGVGDVLAVTFWREQALSGDVVVRPDGNISLPLLNDVQASGLTPEQLAQALAAAAVKFVDDPDVSVIVKEIHSRKVFLVGQVATPGMVPLQGDMTVLQLLAVGGGLLEYADRKDIVIIRSANKQEMRFKFNYDDVLSGKNRKQNILLQPGDTVVVH
jgi:polysaccharide export outer membrane protein